MLLAGRTFDKIINSIHVRTFVWKNWANSSSFSNGNKQPTCRKGEVGDHIHHCMIIEGKIMEKTRLGF